MYFSVRTIYDVYYIHEKDRSVFICKLKIEFVEGSQMDRTIPGISMLSLSFERNPIILTIDPTSYLRDVLLCSVQ